MTKEVEQIVAIYNAGSEELKKAFVRGLRIYVGGTERQKQILDQIGKEKHEWPQVLELIRQAESAE